MWVECKNGEGEGGLIMQRKERDRICWDKRRRMKEFGMGGCEDGNNLNLSITVHENLKPWPLTPESYRGSI